MDYQNPALPVHQRVNDLITRMTLEEKIGQMMQLPANENGNMDKLEEMHIGSYLHITNDQMEALQKRARATRLGIPLIFGIDAIHGHCFENNGTVFPTQLAMSCSWNPELITQAARVTAKEVRATGIHWTFSPVLCVGRDMRWGRVNETFGEDPFIIGELASAMIKGYQGDTLASDDSILACAKHFAGYGDTLGGRDAYEADTSKRKLLTLFLPPFERVVKEGCGSLMTAYHAIDGVPCTANAWLLRETAKEQWGLDGFIVTDWDNVGAMHTRQMAAATLRESTKRAILAGNDMIMNTPLFYQYALELVRKGEIDERLIDDSVKRILAAKFRLGLFDEKRDRAGAQAVLGTKEHLEVSLEASAQSLVMVKNQGILPVDTHRVQRILLVGPNADDIVAQLGDWSFRSHQLHKDDDTFHSDHGVTLLKGLQDECAGRGITLEYIKGADTVDADVDQTQEAASAAKKADLVIACVGDSLERWGEYKDRADLNLSGNQQKLLEAVQAAGKPFVTVLMTSKPLSVPWIKEHSDCVFIAFNPGLFGGKVIAKAIFGELNPQGKLTVSFPYHVGQQPVYYSRYAGWHTQNSTDRPGDSGYIDLPREPLWAFGEGMGYAPFSYGKLVLDKKELEKGEPLTGSVDVTNTGTCEGVEIVQVYVNDIYSSVTTPVKELKTFRRVGLKPGETRTVGFSVPYDALSLVDEHLVRRVEPGEFELMAGSSSRDVDLLKERFTVKG
ncbi:MAG: glycoside hydrolase family 3 C-terminal domain-containing protein [Spirochaetales bacterium]|nr:glycoside hydrolase family 3 C-terminal domain-containing protein [Spirochaetales bacterium]